MDGIVYHIRDLGHGRYRLVIDRRLDETVSKEDIERRILKTLWQRFQEWGKTVEVTMGPAGHNVQTMPLSGR